MLGPVLGSIIGNYLVLVDWRWCFRLMSVLVGMNTLGTIFGMDETYAAVLKKLYDERGGAPDAAGRMVRAKAIFRKNAEAKDVVVRTFTVSHGRYCQRCVGLADTLATSQRPPRMLMNPVCALFVTCPSSRLLFALMLTLTPSTDYAYIYSIIYVYLVSL